MHRAQLHLIRGEWNEAERTALRVAAALDANRVDYAAEAWYVVAEARRLRGDPGRDRCVRRGMNVREELATAVERAGVVLGRIRAAAHERAGSRVRVEVAGGDVAVVVDGNGRLLDIELAGGSARRHRHSLGAIQLFITKASALLGDALERMQGYREARSRMRGAVAKLAQLVPMGHIVGDPTGWQPRASTP